jgi:hypothetical protein
MSDEYEIVGASSVRDVISWAEEKAAGQEIEIAVVVNGSAAYLVGPLDHSRRQRDG